MSTIAPKGDADQDLILALDAGGTMTDAILVKPVSYTHLTLPTKRIV